MNKNRSPKKKSALKHDLLAYEAHERKVEALGDPLQRINSHIDFEALA